MIFFYLLIAVMPLANHWFWGQYIAGMTPFKYLGILCLLYAISCLFVRATWPNFLQSWQARLFLLLSLISTTSYFSHAPQQSIDFSPMFSYVSFLALYIITVVTIDSVRRLRRVLLVMVGSAAFASLYVLREWQFYRGSYAGFRPGWIAGDSNYFALYALISMPIAFCLAVERTSRWERMFCVGSLAVTLLAFTLAASRGGFLGLVVALLFIGWRSRRRLRNLTVAAALIAPLSLLAPSSPLQRLLKPSYGDKVGEVSRTIAWRAGLRMMQDHPLRGIGLGRFKPLVESYENGDATVRSMAHNSYLEVGAEMGIPALLIFLAILYSSYRSLKRVFLATRDNGPRSLHQAALSMQAGLVGSSVAIFFLSGQYNKMFWLLIFLSMCLSSLMQTGRRRSGELHESN